jgi:hypothetical protein
VDDVEMPELRNAVKDEAEPRGPLTISCDDCVMQATEACADCVVTFICSRDPDDAVIFDVAEERAVRMLAKGGLVPELRHVPSGA